MEKANKKLKDRSLMKHLLGFAKPYILPLFVALVLVAVSTLLELLNPFLVKVAIDDHISGDNLPMVVTENPKDALPVTIDGNEFYLKRDKEASGDIYTIESEGGVHSLLKNGIYIGEVDHDKYLEFRKNDTSSIVNIAMLYIAAVIVNFLATWGFNFLLGRTGASIIYDIRKKLFDHLMKQSTTFYNNTSVGSLMTRVTSDTQTLSQFYSDVMVSFIADLGIVIGVMVLMIKLDYKLALMCFTLIPVVIFIAIYFRGIQFKIFRLARSKLSKINTVLNEYLSGMSIIKIFGKEKKMDRAFDDKNADYLNTVLKNVRNNALFRPSFEIVRSLGEAFLIWYGGGKVIQNNMEFGTLFLFITYLKRFFMPIMDMAEKYNITQLAMASVEKVVNLLEIDTEIRPAPEYEKYNIEAEKGDIEFKNVSFSYIEGEPILKDISFKINKGESVAFVGATGAGKSSILSLLARLYDIDSGNIYIDGRDIRTMSTDEIRHRLGFVLQDVFLFSGDIKYNMTLGKEYSESEIIDAAKRVRASDFIEKLPDKYNAKVEERGSTLSTGERQLLSFARTILRDPEILILDEATASIDTETELLIQEGLEELMKDRTTIAVAHRLSTISDMDRIIVMNKGEIVEEGNHQELMALHGYYYRLYQLQLS